MRLLYRQATFENIDKSYFYKNNWTKMTQEEFEKKKLTYTYRQHNEWMNSQHLPFKSMGPDSLTVEHKPHFK